MTKLSYKLKEILNHSGFRKYFTNTSWLFTESILRLIVGLFVGVYVARYLGPGNFGIFSYTLAFVALFGAVSKLGLDSIAVRELVNHPDKRDVYLGTFFWLKVVGALFTLGILGIAIQFTSNDSTTNLYIFIIASGLLFQSFEVVDFYFKSKVLSKYVSICKLTQLALSSLLKLYLVFIKADLFWFVLVILIDYVTLAVSFTFSYWQQKLGLFFRYFEFSIAKEMLKNSWPLILSGIAIMIYMRIDQVMIKGMLNETAVGLYSAAVKLSEVWYFVPVVITNSLFPAVLNAKKKSEALYYERLQRLYDLMVWLALVVAIPMTFFSRYLVVLLYGQAFREASNVLAIHIWTGVFVALGVASSNWFISENLQNLCLYLTAGGAVINVVLNYIFIPTYGIIGAAIASLIAQMSATVLLNVFNRRTIPCFRMQMESLTFLGFRRMFLKNKP